MTECATMDCGRPASLYLCPQCITDLQAWIDMAHAYAPELDVTIAKQDRLRKAGNTGGGGNKAGSAAPISLDALQLQQNLYAVDRDAEAYAHDQFAAGIANTIQDWCQKAERLISGPEAERVDHAAIRAKVENIAPPMPTRQLIQWLRVNAGISLVRADINNWRQRGKLRPVEREPLPTYHPHEVLHLWHERETA